MGGSTTAVRQAELRSLRGVGFRTSSAQRWLDRQFPRLAVLPTSAMMLLVFGIPLLFSFSLSFEGWSPDQALFGGKFAGSANYEDLLTDPQFLAACPHLALHRRHGRRRTCCGLAIALLLNIDLPMDRPVPHHADRADDDHARGRGVLLEAAARPGPRRHQLFHRQHIVWLGRPDTALLSVVVVNVWQNAPYVAILLLAGLRSLPHEPVEAAPIDGASRLQMFWHITLPLLRPYLLVALLLRTIFEFRSFDNIYVMTSGGPANATMTLSMFTYLASFVRFDLSLGAAASWMMLLMSMLLCLFFIAVVRRRDAN